MGAKVLFLAANPQFTGPLALDEEIRSITEKIRLSNERELIEVVSAWAVRPDDLLQLLNQHKPHIVHFSGHGSRDGEIILVDSLGQPRPVSPAALKALFTSLKDNIQVVVLNACYSKTQGEAVSSVIDFVIGMKTSITDQASGIFSASFYRALGFNRSVQEAFEQARTALLLEGIPEAETPELLVRPGADPTRRLISEAAAPVRTASQPKEPASPELAAVQEPAPAAQARLFLCYKSHFQPDEGLAEFLKAYLTQRGQEVFIDKTIRAGEEWLASIDRQIQASDFLIVLLSKASANSQMVQGEVMRAYDYAKLQGGRPRILPVRVAYEEMVPYALGYFLSPVQYIVWNSSDDNQRVAEEILAAAAGCLPDKQPFPVQVGEPEMRALSEDGRVIAADAADLQPPLPEVDPRFLEELDDASGAVKLRSHFYIERDCDRRMRQEVLKTGTTISIQAPRQTGKSSLLVRGLSAARQRGSDVVLLDLQPVDRDYLAGPEVFLRYLANFITSKLQIDRALVDKAFDGPLGPQDKLTILFEDHILPNRQNGIVLAIDEADRLLQTDLHQDFFSLVRAWHNMRAVNELWDLLNIVLVISTEPYLLIKDTSQSPFNVGVRLSLKDFDAAQVQELNRRHGGPVSDKDLPELMKLLGGHPYLTRKALFTLVSDCVTWRDFARTAASSQGPFADHLRHFHWLMSDEPDLRAAFKQIIRSESCPDEAAVYRLLRAGLITSTGEACRCRCGLYRLFFEDKL